MKRPAWMDVTGWEPGVVTMSDGSLHQVVLDPVEEEIVCFTGRADATDQGEREKSLKTAQLIAAIPTTGAYIKHSLQVLEDLVRQYPEGPHNQTPAGQAARETLKFARLLLNDQPQPPKGPPK